MAKGTGLISRLTNHTKTPDPEPGKSKGGSNGLRGVGESTNTQQKGYESPTHRPDDGDLKPLDEYPSVTIEEHALDTEMSQHAAQYHLILDDLALALSLRDEAKTAMEEEYARTGDRVRRELEEGPGRSTEPQIKEGILADSSYLMAKARHHETEKRARRLDALARAYDQRGKMLLKMADMWMAGYYTASAAKSAQVGRGKMAVVRGELIREDMQASRRQQALEQLGQTES